MCKVMRDILKFVPDSNKFNKMEREDSSSDEDIDIASLTQEIKTGFRVEGQQVTLGEITMDVKQNEYPWHQISNIESSTRTDDVPVTLLYHSSEYDPDTNVGSTLANYYDTFYHTNPEWSFFENTEKARFILRIASNIVERIGHASSAYRQLTYSTIVMPPIVVKVSAKNLTGEKSIPTYNVDFICEYVEDIHHNNS
jgi:hypothetical protein